MNTGIIFIAALWFTVLRLSWQIDRLRHRIEGLEQKSKALRRQEGVSA